MPQTNGIVERAVQEVLAGTRTLLVQAGMPGYFWSYAAPCYCLQHNTRIFPHIHTATATCTLPGAGAGDDEYFAYPVAGEDVPSNAWAKRHGQDFPGKRPFLDVVFY